MSKISPATSPFQRALENSLKGQVLVGDGATGTELQRRGLEPGACPEEWNLSRPSVVEDLAQSYFQAGADYVTTNSFGANRLRLRHFGLADQVAEINRAAARLASSPRPPGKFVAGSMGPLGQLLAPLGPVDREQARQAFSEQALALEEGGVDFLLVESMTGLEETLIAVAAARENTRLPVLVTMTFDPGKRGLHTSMGVSVATAVQALVPAGVQALGANCGNGFDEVIQVIAEMRPLTSLPLIAQPNAGLPQLETGKVIYPETPQSIVPKVRGLLQVKANVIGGCCGTTPEHIRTIREIVTATWPSPGA